MIKKKTSAKNLSEGKRHFGVVLEHIDSRFNQVLDGHTALDKKIDNFREEVHDELDLLKVGQKALTERVDDLTGSSKQILDYLSKIDEEIGDIKDGLSQKADLKYVQRLEIRLANVEAIVKKHYE